MPKLNPKSSFPKLVKKRSAAFSNSSRPTSPGSSRSPTPPVPPISIKPVTQWVSNVNRLNPEDSERAHFAAGLVHAQFISGATLNPYYAIKACKQEDGIRIISESTDLMDSATLKTRAHIMLEDTDIQTPERLRVPSNRSILTPPHPTSPTGNAWSGEHYWSPIYSSSTPDQLAARDADFMYSPPPSPSLPSHPRDRELYMEILDAVEELAFDIRGEFSTLADAQVAAASRVLELKVSEFEDFYNLQHPEKTYERMGEREAKKGVILNSFKGLDINDVSTSASDIATVIDTIRARIKAIKSRASGVDLAMSTAGVALVWATKAYDDTVDLQLCSSVVLSTDEEGEEDTDYDNPIKSIQEEIKNECSKERRRKRLALNFRDWEEVARELRELGVEDEEMGEEGENGGGYGVSISPR